MAINAKAKLNSPLTALSRFYGQYAGCTVCIEGVGHTGDPNECLVELAIVWDE